MPLVSEGSFEEDCTAVARREEEWFAREESWLSVEREVGSRSIVRAKSRSLTDSFGCLLKQSGLLYETGRATL